MQDDGGSSQKFDAAPERRLSDALRERDVEARKDREAAEARERARLEEKRMRQKKIEQLQAIPDDTPAGSIDDYMYQEGVSNILEQLDRDLV
eukprot:ctg_6390.g544